METFLGSGRIHGVCPESWAQAEAYTGLPQQTRNVRVFRTTVFAVQHTLLTDPADQNLTAWIHKFQAIGLKAFHPVSALGAMQLHHVVMRS